jgi:HTH-type transcriptional regulator/antitoxin HigA
MEKLMNTQLDDIYKAWPTVKSVFSVPHSEKEYQELVKTLDSLIDEVGDNEAHPLAPVMETVGRLVENYEDHNYTTRESSPANCLKYLMQEHDLKASDLNEIGNEDTVSDVLAGKKSLDIKQIKKISKRFRISPMVFI